MTYVTYILLFITVVTHGGKNRKQTKKKCALKLAVLPGGERVWTETEQ